MIHVRLTDSMQFVDTPGFRSINTKEIAVFSDSLVGLVTDICRNYLFEEKSQGIERDTILLLCFKTLLILHQLLLLGDIMINRLLCTIDFRLNIERTVVIHGIGEVHLLEFLKRDSRTYWAV